MSDFLNDIVSQHITALQKKKEEFLKQKFKDKGYELSATTLTRFPKAACIKIDEWEYWYADNGTRLGEFIVAIKEVTVAGPVETPGKYGYQSTIFFNWQDTQEPPALMRGADLDRDWGM